MFVMINTCVDKKDRKVLQESCAITKMTVRCVLYKWIEWAVGFDVNGNSAIRSADPENHTLEPNMKCIRSPVAEIWPFAYLGGIWNPLFGGKGRSYGVSDGTIRKSDGGFL